MLHWTPFLVIGLIAGWLGGVIIRGRGFDLAGDIVMGIIGAVALLTLIKALKRA